jgi:hypothetical protein
MKNSISIICLKTSKPDLQGLSTNIFFLFSDFLDITLAPANEQHTT